MDANMMKFAMEQMQKMDPQQLQAMMRNMPPDAMNQAMAQMKGMKPEDWEHAKQQMASMDPDTLTRQAAQASAQMAGRTQYVINASNQLKAEGNQLHGRGAYKEAVEKYERAKSNVESFTSQEARDLLRACTLNLSSCYLNLKQYDKCVAQCNQVLSGEPDNLKALYRRGQAYLGSGDCVTAAADLERALRLARDTDPSQSQPIREKLQEAKDQIGALRAAGKLPPAGAATDAPVIAEAKPVKAEEDGAKTVATAAHAAAPTSGPDGSRSGGRLGPDPEMLARASEVVRSNPGVLKRAQDLMRGMNDEDLRGVARQMGVEVAPEALRSGLKDLDPEMMLKVAQMQAELPPELRGPDAARNPENMRHIADLMAKKPEMAEAMGQMLSSMDPEKLQEMSRAAGFPSGVTITPEMAKMAAESFKNMSPQEVQEAIQTVTKMQQQQPAAMAETATTAGNSSCEASAAAASTSERDVAAAAVPPTGMPVIDPRVAADMLSAMSPEQLASMSKMVPGMDGVQLTPEMAKMAADMMKGMTADDLARMQQMAAAMHGGTAAGPGAMAAPSVSGAVAGGAFSPEMAAAAADMMKNMGPEDVARMQEMAAKMGMGGAGGMPPGGFGAGAGAGDAAMASMFSDPKMIESAVRMMRGMDPEAMASMMVSSGMCRDRAQAEAMAREMSSLSDTQLRMMVKAAGAVQSARAVGARALEWVRANRLLVAALVVLLIAVLLRWLGFM